MGEDGGGPPGGAGGPFGAGGMPEGFAVRACVRVYFFWRSVYKIAYHPFFLSPSPPLSPHQGFARGGPGGGGGGMPRGGFHFGGFSDPADIFAQFFGTSSAFDADGFSFDDLGGMGGGRRGGGGAGARAFGTCVCMSAVG